MASHKCLSSTHPDSALSHHSKALALARCSLLHHGRCRHRRMCSRKVNSGFFPYSLNSQASRRLLPCRLLQARALMSLASNDPNNSTFNRNCNSKPLASCNPDRLGMDSSRHKLDSNRSEEHTSELQSHSDLVCRLL